LAVPKATALRVAEEMSESLVSDINEVQMLATNVPIKPPRKKKKKTLNQKLLPGKLDNLAEKEGQKIEFVVEHRAGSKVGHVNALSRHVGAILQEGILDRKNILQEQAKDAFCTKQVARANKKYLNNKFWYDRKAKQRKVEVNDFISTIRL
jgi:hypothetical protein